VHVNLVKVGAPKLPPIANAAFCIPAPPKHILEVIRDPPVDHEPSTTGYENSTLPVSAVTLKLPII
jgi:hypothetical protein